MEQKVIFVNAPDVSRIMQTLCELRSKQDGGKYEYIYSPKQKGGKGNEEQRKSNRGAEVKAT